MNIVPTHTTEHGYKEPPLVEWRAGLKGYQLIHNMHQVEEDTWNHRFTEEILQFFRHLTNLGIGLGQLVKQITSECHTSVPKKENINVVKTIFTPMTGNGNHTTDKHGDLGDDLLLF